MITVVPYGSIIDDSRIPGRADSTHHPSCWCSKYTPPVCWEGQPLLELPLGQCSFPLPGINPTAWPKLSPALSDVGRPGKSSTFAKSGQSFGHPHIK